MNEVYAGLWLQPGQTTKILIASLGTSFAVVHAAQDWYTEVKGSTLLKTTFDPEYFAAWRGSQLYLNMVDSSDPKYFSHALIDPALLFISINHQRGIPVLVHCDMGVHRSPTLMLLYLAMIEVLPSKFEEAVATFKHMYPYFSTTHENGKETGIYQWVRTHWGEYV